MSSSSAPNSPNRLLTWLLWLLALVGPPTVGITFAHITLSWQTFWGMLLYEIIILFIGFIAVIGQQLQNNWSKRIADRIDRRLQAIMPGYQKRYCRLLIEQHIQFEVGGLRPYPKTSTLAKMS